MAKVIFDADASKHIAELQKVNKSLQEQINTTKKIVDEDKKRETQAKRLLREQETGQERINRKLKEADDLLKKGNLTTEEHTRVTERLRGKLQQTFGTQLQTHLRNTLVQYFGITAAMSAATRVANELTAAFERQRQIASQARGGFLELGQLPGGAQLRREALALREAGGASSISEAGARVFALRSSPFDEDTIRIFKRLAESGVIEDLEQAVRGAGTVRVGFGPGAGTGREILRKGLVAAAPGQTSLGEILAATGGAGEVARQAGISDEEAFAAVSILGEAFGLEEGATRFRRLAQVLAPDERFRGRRLAENIRAIQQLAPTPAAVAEFFPESRAREAFLNLASNLPTFEERRADIEAAERRPVIEDVLRQQQRDPLAQFAIQTRRAEGVAETRAFRVGAAEGRGEVEATRAEFLAGLAAGLSMLLTDCRRLSFSNSTIFSVGENEPVNCNKK